MGLKVLEIINQVLLYSGAHTVPTVLYLSCTILLSQATQAHLFSLNLFKDWAIDVLVVNLSTQILRTIIGDDPDLLEEPDDDSEKVEGINLDWTPWKTGIVYKCKGRTLLLIKQEADSTPDDLPPDNVFQPLNGDYRIEVHIYTNEWISLANYLSEQGILNSSLSPDFIPGLATRLLVVISTHIKSLAINYFSGMLLTHQNQNTVTYMPCWKCFAEIDAGKIKYEEYLPGSCFIWRNKKTPVTCFGVEDSVIGAIKGEDFGCAIHGSIKAVHLAPDLVRDLVNIH